MQLADHRSLRLMSRVVESKQDNGKLRRHQPLGSLLLRIGGRRLMPVQGTGASDQSLQIDRAAGDVCAISFWRTFFLVRGRLAAWCNNGHVQSTRERGPLRSGRSSPYRGEGETRTFREPLPALAPATRALAETIWGGNLRAVTRCDVLEKDAMTAGALHDLTRVPSDLSPGRLNRGGRGRRLWLLKGGVVVPAGYAGVPLSLTRRYLLAACVEVLVRRYRSH